MRNSIVQTATYLHLNVEQTISQLETDLIAFVSVQGKEDGQKEELISESIFNITIREHVWSKTQKAIDIIKQILGIQSKAGGTADQANITVLYKQRCQSEINERCHKLPPLKEKLKTYCLDHHKRRWGVWLMPVALILGLGDGFLAFPAFRDGSFTFLQALFASVAIATGIAFAHHSYRNWICTTQRKRERWLRISVVLAIALMFFAWIGHLRADASNNRLDISLEGDAYSAIPHVNGWAITVISLMLFCIVMGFALAVWRSKNELEEERQCGNTIQEIKRLENEIAVLEKEIKDTEDAVVGQKQNLRTMYFYALDSFIRCKNISQVSINTYKVTYIRFHRNPPPPFFSKPCILEYDENFNFQSMPKTESI